MEMTIATTTTTKGADKGSEGRRQSTGIRVNDDDDNNSDNDNDGTGDPKPL